MKGEDRVELFRRGFEVYSSGDVDAALQFYDPSVEVTAPDWMNAGPLRGHEGFLKWAQLWNEAWDSIGLEILSAHPVGERHVVARVRVSGRGRGSGVEVEHEAGYVVDVRDGLCVYLEITADEDRALTIAHEREVSN